MSRFNDGYIIGELEGRKEQCHNCGTSTRCVAIHDIKLPQNILAGPTLIPFRKVQGEFKPMDRIGIECGCYARAQRQVAHIKRAREGRG